MRLGTWSTSAESAWDPIQPRGGGGSGTSDSGGGGVCVRNRVVGGYRDGVNFPPMTWGALSEARRVPPQETVVRGHGDDYCACRCNTSKYNINSYNTGSYRRYIQYRHIHTIQTHTYNGQPAKNNLLDLGARALRQSFLPKKLYLHILSKLHTEEYIHIHTIHTHTYT